jgi:hypothetical protein
MDDELAQVPEEFRAACGRPGSSVIVRHFPVTIPHAQCDLTGVTLSPPGSGGATVSATPSAVYRGSYLGGSFSLIVHAGTLDVTVDVQPRPGEPHP